jgi:hypothetical protein
MSLPWGAPVHLQASACPGTAYHRCSRRKNPVLEIWTAHILRQSPTRQGYTVSHPGPCFHSYMPFFLGDRAD